MANIQDVAKKAGVAPITVSRVINNAGYVTADVRRRVEAAIAELGYVPNSLARGLRSRRTNTLALVLSDITNPFFTTVARGVEDAASTAGFTVIFCNTDESPDKERKYLQVLIQKRVDGVLLIPTHSNADAVKFILQQHIPVVVIDRHVPKGLADVVRCDSRQGAYDLIRLLLSLGHRHIAILTGHKGVSTSVDRVAGYRRALVEAGVTPCDEDVYYGAFTQASGCEAARAAMSRSPRPTALFAANNFIAIGALRAIREMGLRVPDDVALVSFDDLPPALVTFPFLTVVAQPAYEMGQKATQLLLDRLAEQSNSPAPFQELVLPTELIVRQSSGCALA